MAYWGLFRHLAHKLCIGRCLRVSQQKLWSPSTMESLSRHAHYRSLLLAQLCVVPSTPYSHCRLERAQLWSIIVKTGVRQYSFECLMAYLFMKLMHALTILKDHSELFLFLLRCGATFLTIAILDLFSWLLRHGYPLVWIWCALRLIWETMRQVEYFSCGADSFPFLWEGSSLFLNMRSLVKITIHYPRVFIISLYL